MVLVVIKERERVKEREREEEVFLLLLFAERGGEKRGERRRDVMKKERGVKMDEMRVVFSSFFFVCPPSFLAKTGGGLSVYRDKKKCLHPLVVHRSPLFAGLPLRVVVVALLRPLLRPLLPPPPP